jgi:hypothetical protein
VFNNRSILPTLNDAWFAGFTDGEGCFTCSINAKRGFSFNFNISQKWEINLKILEHFCVLFKGGIVYKHSEDNLYGFRLEGLKIVVLFFLILIIIHYTLKNIYLINYGKILIKIF